MLLVGMDVVLTQSGHPVSFFSKKLLSLTKFLHIHMQITCYHSHNTDVAALLGNQFIIKADHKSLREIMNEVVQIPDQHYYLTKLLDYDYIISYNLRKSKKVALLRKDLPAKSQLLVLSTPSFDFLSILLTENNNFSDMRELHREVK